MRWLLQMLLIMCMCECAYIQASEETVEVVAETTEPQPPTPPTPPTPPVAPTPPTPPAQPEQPVAQPAPEQQAVVAEQPVAQPAPVQTTEQPAAPAAPAEPAPLPPEAQPSPRAPVVEELSEVVGIDTIELSEPQGNWLFKRFWWEKAEKQYEKTKKAVDQVYEERMKFFEERSDLDRKVFIPFYNMVGTEKGDIVGTLEYLIEDIQTERSEDGLTQQQKEFYKTLQNEKKSLEQLKADIDMVSKIDDALDAALIKLMELVNRARMYERQSWDNFKTITRELSDKKAFEQYSSMSTHITNINDLLDYIKTSFAPHFNKLKSMANEQTEKIKNSLKSLKEKGINLKAETKRLKKEREESKLQPIEVEEEEIKAPGFFGSITNAISQFFGSIGSSIQSFFGYFTWSKTTPVDEEDETTEVVAEPAKKDETLATTK